MGQRKQQTLSRKNWMAFTGLFLCLYLVIHLAGNLQLFLPEERAHRQFNLYSHILSGNLIIKAISYILFASIIGHVVYAIIITVANNRARKVRYYYDRRGTASKWYSRNMGLLGTIIFIFLVMHLRDFWYVYKFGQLPMDADGHKDLYVLVVGVYSELWYVILYVICMIALCYHLLHGFFSAARTLGLYHPRYAQAIRIFGWVFSIVICTGFAAMPLYVYCLK